MLKRVMELTQHLNKVTVRDREVHSSLTHRIPLLRTLGRRGLLVSMLDDTHKKDAVATAKTNVNARLQQ